MMTHMQFLEGAHSHKQTVKEMNNNVKLMVELKILRFKRQTSRQNHALFSFNFIIRFTTRKKNKWKMMIFSFSFFAPLCCRVSCDRQYETCRCLRLTILFTLFFSARFSNGLISLWFHEWKFFGAHEQRIIRPDHTSQYVVCDVIWHFYFSY